MFKNNVNPDPALQEITYDKNINEISSILHQLSPESVNSLLGFARGLLKSEKLTGN
jgi:hypothetical protein